MSVRETPESGVRGVEKHHDVALVFAVHDHAAERHQQQRWQRLRYDEHPEQLFRMRGLEDVPDHCGGVYPTSSHGHKIGGEQETQRPTGKEVPHLRSGAEPLSAFSRLLPHDVVIDSNHAAVSRVMAEMGRRGGLKGGKARAATLTEEKRREIARRAAQKRWAVPRPQPQTGFEEQKRAFEAISAKVLAAYSGRFVVSRNGKIVDSDENLSTLTRRFFHRHRSARVYITRVGDHPLRILTPLTRG